MEVEIKNVERSYGYHRLKCVFSGKNVFCHFVVAFKIWMKKMYLPVWVKLLQIDTVFLYGNLPGKRYVIGIVGGEKKSTEKLSPAYWSWYSWDVSPPLSKNETTIFLWLLRVFIDKFMLNDETVRDSSLPASERLPGRTIVWRNS